MDQHSVDSCLALSETLSLHQDGTCCVWRFRKKDPQGSDGGCQIGAPPTVTRQLMGFITAKSSRSLKVDTKPYPLKLWHDDSCLWVRCYNFDIDLDYTITRLHGTAVERLAEFLPSTLIRRDMIRVAPQFGL